MVGVRVARGRAGHQHGDRAGYLMFAEPVPGEVAPVIRVLRQLDRVCTVGEGQSLTDAAWRLKATIQTGGLKREIIRAVVPV